ncbi:MAG: cupin domain-containing protein [Bacteroidales bacterium]|jgi:predicted cupin superfamily sugar epimerase|nr:cupin domain-containing protein [Bacteroidales bacterium]
MKSVHSASYWKTRYAMQPHPEGGFYKEIYRSKLDLNVPWAEKRAASTGIVYLLENQNISAFHRIKSDELWHFYDGNSSVLIHCIEPDGSYTKLKLGYDDDALPCQIVHAGTWFAAELSDKENAFVLSGCTVSPGFSFEDFEIADPSQLMKQYSQHKSVIERFTDFNK